MIIIILYTSLCIVINIMILSILFSCRSIFFNRILLIELFLLVSLPYLYQHFSCTTIDILYEIIIMIIQKDDFRFQPFFHAENYNIMQKIIWNVQEDFFSGMLPQRCLFYKKNYPHNNGTIRNGSTPCYGNPIYIYHNHCGITPYRFFFNQYGENKTKYN